MKLQELKRIYWEFREGGIDSLIDRLPFGETGDRVWTIARYYRMFGRLPELDPPSRFSEYLVWLKLSDEMSGDLRTRVSDKEAVKAYVADKLGPGHTPRTLALLTTEAEALAFDFPDTCVIKPTHMSGEVILRYDGEPLDRARVAQWLNLNYYTVGREPNYRKLPPRVLVEELLIERGQAVPRDYKVFCSYGEPVLVQVDEDRFGDHRHSFYTTSWTPLPFECNYPRLREDPPPPDNFDEMLEAARALAADFCFMRVDFYVIDGRLYVGELTSVPQNGGTVFVPDSADVLVGRLFLDGAAGEDLLESHALQSDGAGSAAH